MNRVLDDVLKLFSVLEQISAPLVISIHWNTPPMFCFIRIEWWDSPWLHIRRITCGNFLKIATEVNYHGWVINTCGLIIILSALCTFQIFHNKKFKNNFKIWMLEIYTKPIRSEPLGSETSASVFFNIPQVIFMCRQCWETGVKKKTKTQN